MALLTQDRKILGTLGAAQDTVKVNSAGLATVTFQIPTGLVGTVTFEATDDDAASPALVSIPATNVATGTRATFIANPAGIYRVDASGLRMVQARVSAYTSGTTAVIANGSSSSYADPSGVTGGGGGGGGAVTIADGADVAEGTTTDAAIVTDTSGTVVGFLRGIVKTLIATLTFQGTKTNNAAAPGTNNVGVLPAIATAAVQSWTEGRLVNQSVNLSGAQLTGFAGTGATIRTWTASNSVTNTAGNDVPGMGPLVYDVTGALWNRQRDTTSADNSSGTGLAGAGLLAWDGSVYRRVSINASGQLVLSSSKAEDAGHTTGDMGTFALAVRQDTQSALAGTTLDYIPFTTDANGSLRAVAGGYTTVLTTTITRPADTTAYAAGDEFTDTGGAIATITGAARFSGGSGIIQGVYVSQSTLWTTKPQMEIWVYDTTSTPVADNGAFAPTDGVTDTCIGIIPLNVTYAGTVNQALDSGQVSIPFLTVGSANLYFRVVIRNAAQDSAVSGVSKFRWRVLMD